MVNDDVDEDTNIVTTHGFQDWGPFDSKEKGAAFKKRLTKEGYKVYSLSYSRGQKTDKPLNYYVEELKDVIDENDIKKIYGLVLHSLAGSIGCKFVMDYPEFGVKKVAMLESALLGVPAWVLRIWVKMYQKQASFSWQSVQDMRNDSDFTEKLNKRVWPANVHRLMITGKMSVQLSYLPLTRAFEVPKGIPVRAFPEVGHDGPTGLRTNPAVLDCIAEFLKSNP